MSMNNSLSLPQRRQHIFSRLNPWNFQDSLGCGPVGRKIPEGKSAMMNFILCFSFRLIEGGSRREGQAFRIDSPFLLRKQNLVPHPP